MIHLYIAIGLAVVALIIFIVGRLQGSKTNSFNQYVEASRPSELGAGTPAFYGGTVTLLDGAVALQTPYAKQPCVWYDYVIEEEQPERDANGNETLIWRTVSQPPASGVRFALLSTSDANGSAVYVDPANADVNHPQQYEQFIDAVPNTSGGFVGALGSAVNIAEAISGRRTRVRERFVPVGQFIYAGGVCSEIQGQKLFANDGHYPLVLTTQSKADLVKSGRRTSAIEYAVAAALLIAAVAVFSLVKK